MKCKNCKRDIERRDGYFYHVDNGMMYCRGENIGQPPAPRAEPSDDVTISRVDLD